MVVAVTGANGFLGSYIVKAFLETGHKVIALVRKSADFSTLEIHQKVQIEVVDYSNKLDLQFIALKEKYGDLTYFIHNAGVTVSLKKEEYFQVNVELTKSILKGIKSSGWLPPQAKWIQVSSMAATGPYASGQPVSQYGESKLAAEKAIIKSSFPHLILRPTGIYGAGDVAFLPLFKLAAKGIYPLTRRTQKMSMIHASDLSRTIVKEARNNSGVLHVSDGNTYSHQDFIKSLEAATKKKIRRIPTSGWLSRASLGLSDIWHRTLNKRPGLTLEKFQEISDDWHLHENPELRFSLERSKVSLTEGFQDAFNYYQKNNLL
ncbi:MAG: SDR family NAD(P)-dependent oxidoreductase [Bacteroidota bacterium]